MSLKRKKSLYIAKDTYASNARGSNDRLSPESKSPDDMAPGEVPSRATSTMTGPQTSGLGKPSAHAVNPPPAPVKGSAGAGAKAMAETATPAASPAPAKVTQTPTPEPVHAGSMQPALPEKTAMAKPQVTKAMTSVQASPTAASSPPSYLPGVHNPNSPMRPGKKPKVKKCMTKKSENATSDPQPRRRARSSTGGTTVKMPPISNQEAAANLRAGIRKSDTKETDMSKNAMQDLFKSELGGGKEDSDAITKCVHCKHDLSKSDLVKGLGTSFVADDNDNPSSGGSGQVEPSRGVPGAKENDEIAPLLKGLKGADKGNDEEFLITKGEMAVMGLDVSDHADDSDDQFYIIAKSELLRHGCEKHMPYIVDKKMFMMKSIGADVKKAQPIVDASRAATDGPQTRTNPNGGLIQWVNTGEDERLAKSIEMGGGFGPGHDESIKTQGRDHR